MAALSYPGRLRPFISLVGMRQGELRSANGVDGLLVYLDVDALDDASIPAVDSRRPELLGLLRPLLRSDLAVGMEVTILTSRNRTKTGRSRRNPRMP